MLQIFKEFLAFCSKSINIEIRMLTLCWHN